MDYFTGNTPAERLVCDTLYAIEARPKTGPFAGQEMLKTLIKNINNINLIFPALFQIFFRNFVTFKSFKLTK